MGLFFPDYGTTQTRLGGERYSFLAVAGMHVAALAAIAVIAPPDRLVEAIRPFAARMVELAPEKKPELPPPPAPKKKVQPLPVMVTKEVTQDAPVFAVAPQPPAPVSAPPLAAAPVEQPITAARFDADYLDNPKPVYPHASRRLGEQGKVLLRVYVSSDGHAEKVEIKASSGFDRLDAAAREAVARWRFIPARRGDQQLAAWVQVPITFQLNS